jgi:HK97 family phage major capsid protein
MSKATKEFMTAALDFGGLVQCEILDEENREVRLTWACETPFPRWFGMLQLAVNEESCDLSRLKNRAAIIDDHWGDQVGVITKVWLANGFGYAEGRFSRNRRAAEIYNDIKDGIRTHVSPGFVIHELTLVEEKEGEEPLYRADKWTPHETSIVRIAAMDELKVASERPGGPWRSEHMEALVASARGARLKEAVMPDQKTNQPVAVEEASAAGATNATPDVPPVQVHADHEAEKAHAELNRQKDIRQIGARLGADVAAINAAIDAKQDAQGFMLEQLDARQSSAQTANAEDIGMTADDVSKFRLMKVIRAHAEPNKAVRARLMDEAGFEMELIAAASEKRAKINGNITIPHEVVRASANTEEPSEGGFLVNRSRGSMVDILTASTKVLQLGASTAGDLVGDVDLPRLDAGMDAYVIGEDEEPTDSNPSIGLLTLRPRGVGCTGYITRSQAKQTSYDMEMLFRAQIARSIALKVDSLAIKGVGGRHQPIGILNWTGIGSVAGGTNGLAPTWDHVVKLEGEIDQDNALQGRMAYLTNGKMRSTLKRTPKHSTAMVNGWVWENGGDANDRTVGMLNGYPAHVSNQVPSDLTKGSASEICSAIIMGNWDDLLIASWGGIDLTVDPYTNSKKGGTQVTAFIDFDSIILRAPSFASMQDALAKA